MYSVHWEIPSVNEMLHQPSELLSPRSYIRLTKKIVTILGNNAEVVNSANDPELILGAC